MIKIIDFLKQLGLSKAESEIYSRLLQLGHSSVTELSQSLGMNRVTAHVNVQKLVERGLITKVRQGRERELMAQPPEALGSMIQDQEHTVEQIRKDFPEALHFMKNMIPKLELERKFEVKFFQGEEGVRNIYKQVLKSRELRSFVNIQQIFETFPDNPNLFPEAVKHNQLKMWEIIEDSPRSREYVKKVDPKNYNYKFFPKDWDTSKFSDFMIYSNDVAIITVEKSEPYGVLITSKNVSDNTKNIFDLVWSLLPKVT